MSLLFRPLLSTAASGPRRGLRAAPYARCPTTGPAAPGGVDWQTLERTDPGSCFQIFCIENPCLSSPQPRHERCGDSDYYEEAVAMVLGAFQVSCSPLTYGGGLRFFNYLLFPFFSLVCRCLSLHRSKTRPTTAPCLKWCSRLSRWVEQVVRYEELVSAVPTSHPAPPAPPHRRPTLASGPTPTCARCCCPASEPSFATGAMGAPPRPTPRCCRCSR